MYVEWVYDNDNALVIVWYENWCIVSSLHVAEGGCNLNMEKIWLSNWWKNDREVCDDQLKVKLIYNNNI